LTESRL